jgi:hypothetical protein
MMADRRFKEPTYPAVIYGFGVLKTSISIRLARLGFDRGTIFEGLLREESDS